MAEKTSDPYYDRFEALIDKFLSVGEMMQVSDMLLSFTKNPERYGSLISAMYRARAMVRPGMGHASNFDDMSDSQLEDALLELSSIGGYQLVRPPMPHEGFNEADIIVPLKRSAPKLPPSILGEEDETQSSLTG
jgi:hypothetical protein